MILSQKSRQHIGNFLATKRQDAGLSQRDISQALRYSSPQAISNIERGIAPPPKNVLKAYARRCNINQDALAVMYVSRVFADLKTALK